MEDKVEWHYKAPSYNEYKLALKELFNEKQFL